MFESLRHVLIACFPTGSIADRHRASEQGRRRKGGVRWCISRLIPFGGNGLGARSWVMQPLGLYLRGGVMEPPAFSDNGWREGAGAFTRVPGGASRETKSPKSDGVMKPSVGGVMQPLGVRTIASCVDCVSPNGVDCGPPSSLRAGPPPQGRGKMVDTALDAVCVGHVAGDWRLCEGWGNASIRVG